MRLYPALAALPLLLSAQLAFAADDKPKVDFDQGPNASALLKEAREKSGVPAVRSLHEFREIAPSANLSKVAVPASLKLAVMAPPPSESPTAACEAYVPENDGRPSGLLSTCPESETAKSCPANPTVSDLLPKFLRDLAVAPGTIFNGPFGPMPQASAIYRDGSGLKNQVQTAPSIPADTRGALLKDWSEIESVGSGLANDGNGIDVEDGALYTDAIRINLWADRIRARLAILQRLAGEYNQRCRSGPLPPGEVAACNQWADRFNGCVDRHNAAVQRYQQAVDVWNANYDKLEPRVSGFRVRLQNWENLRIKPFIEQAKKALEEAMCNKLTGVVVSPKAATLYTGGMTKEFEAIPSYEAPGDRPCKTTYSWAVVPKTPTGPGEIIGYLWSTSMKATTFETLNAAGDAAITVSAKDATGQFPDEANVKVLPSPVIIEQCNLISAPPICNYRCVVSGRVVARSPQPDGTCKNPIYEQVPRSGR